MQNNYYILNVSRNKNIKNIVNRVDIKILLCYDLAIEKKTPLTERQKGIVICMQNQNQRRLLSPILRYYRRPYSRRIKISLSAPPLQLLQRHLGNRLSLGAMMQSSVRLQHLMQRTYILPWYLGHIPCARTIKWPL